MQARAADPIIIENGRRSIKRFLEPLLRLPHVQADFLGSFQIGTEDYSLPRFSFCGPNSSDPIRIGLFGAIHGDEPAGALALASFLTQLAQEPDLPRISMFTFIPCAIRPGSRTTRVIHAADAI